MISKIVAGVFLTATAVVIASACDGGGKTLGPAINAGLEPCPAGNAVFTAAPIRLDSMAGWVPLGNLNPPAHTFPTDHQYLYLPFADASSVPAAVGVVAPGHVYITGAKRTEYSTRPTADYAVEFSPCQSIVAEYGHLQTLTKSLLDRIGPFDQACQTYSPDASTTVTSCYTKSAAVEMTAGELMGTTGGVAGVFGMDFLLFDNRVSKPRYANDGRWTANSAGFDHFHIAPASDYFAEPLKSQIAAKLGSADGKVIRTVAPIGGSIATDIPNTAQGAWFRPGMATYPESPHLAIVPDNVDPTRFVFSVGTSQPGMSPGVRAFVPASDGALARNPGQVTADNTVYCYAFGANGAILLQLINGSTLRVEARPSAASCGAPPYAFKGIAVDYVR